MNARYTQKQKKSIAKEAKKIGVVETSRTTGASIPSIYKWMKDFNIKTRTYTKRS